MDRGIQLMKYLLMSLVLAGCGGASAVVVAPESQAEPEAQPEPQLETLESSLQLCVVADDPPTNPAQEEKVVPEPEPEPPPPSAKERARLIRKHSREFRNPPKDHPEWERKFLRFGPMLELDRLGAIEPGMSKKRVRSMLGKPDDFYTQDPGYKDYPCDEEWSYETSPVGAYFVGFYKGKVTFTQIYRESNGGPPWEEDNGEESPGKDAGPVYECSCMLRSYENLPGVSYSPGDPFPVPAEQRVVFAPQQMNNMDSEGSFFELTAQDVERANGRILEFLLEGAARSGASEHSPDDFAALLKRLRFYRVQYFGMVREGERLVKGNFYMEYPPNDCGHSYLDSEKSVNWREELVRGWVGEKGRWQIGYNLRTAEIDYFWIAESSEWGC